MSLIIIPAVDILDHKVVQLVGGVRGTEKIVIPDPIDIAGKWIEKGAKYLHIVDLDAAFGKKDNIPVIKKIIETYDVPIEIGGGIKEKKTINELLEAGADRVIIGTKAIKDRAWMTEVVNAFPNRLLLAMDTKGGKIATKGWQDSSEITVNEMFDFIRDIPLAGILNTNVDVEGQGKGIDARFATDFIKRCPHKVIASGGVTSETDAKILDSAGAIGAVVGVAIYTGIMEPWRWKTPWIAKK